MIEQYTYWSITINKPDENDYVLVRNPNSKYIRELVWTREIGANEGTKHIQGWLRLQRNQTQAFVKKLYPRAHLKPCRKDEYNENCHQYAQKNDDTTAGNHHILLNDPLPNVDTILYTVLQQGFEELLARDDIIRDHYENGGIQDVIPRITLKRIYTDIVEREMITKRSGLEKLFISPTYEKMKSKYWREILSRLFTIKDASECSSQTGSAQENNVRWEDHEGYEDSESSEAERYSTSGSSYDSSSNVSEEH